MIGVNQAGEGTSSGSERGRGLTGYMEPGSVQSGAFEGSRMVASHWERCRDPRDSWRQVHTRYSHTFTPIYGYRSHVQAGTKKSRVLLLREGTGACKSYRACKCHQTRHTLPRSVADLDGPVDPQAFSSYNASYLDIGIPVFL